MVRRINLLYLESQLLVILPTHSALPLGEGSLGLECTACSPSVRATHRLKAENKRPGEEEIAQMAAYKLAWYLHKN